MQEDSEEDAGPAGGEAVTSDHRGERRSSLLLRTAKLICQSGEYPCLVRDVSSGGVKLRLFHPMPPETNVFLELGNGEVYALILVWERDGHAGFRFTGQIDVREFIEEPSPYSRRAVRLRIPMTAMLHTRGFAVPVQLRDLSQHGAGIECDTPLALRQPVRLEIPGIPERTGRVCWRKRSQFGIVFDTTVRLDELAAQALALQPFITPAADTDELRANSV